jgi:hypothetical protein
MSAEQRIPNYLHRLGLTTKDVDVVFLVASISITQGACAICRGARPCA